jgi:hypothetical protein
MSKATAVMTAWARVSAQQDPQFVLDVAWEYVQGPTPRCRS